MRILQVEIARMKTVCGAKKTAEEIYLGKIIRNRHNGSFNVENAPAIMKWNQQC
jgi:hypothetical protein